MDDLEQILIETIIVTELDLAALLTMRGIRTIESHLTQSGQRCCSYPKNRQSIAALRAWHDGSVQVNLNEYLEARDYLTKTSAY